MLDVLVASRPTWPARRGWPAALASAALHGGLITLGILATRQAPLPPRVATVVADVRWPAPPGGGRRPRPLLPAQPRVKLPGTLLLPGTILPPGDLPAAPGTAWTEGLPGDFGLPGDSAGATFPPTGTPLAISVVDEAPALLAHPTLRYPELLRQAGIEGAVLVEAVLDTLGRIEPASLRISRGAHPLFEREALAVVLASRYRPARIGPRAVRVRIHVPVTFTMQR